MWAVKLCSSKIVLFLPGAASLHWLTYNHNGRKSVLIVDRWLLADKD